MELIYALLIFFGAMTPDQYGCDFNAQSYQQAIQNSQQIIQQMVSDPAECERIRTMDIDRLED